ncbi:MAG: hypothetical protein ABIY55_20415 [Kofleriaceae bacterium]
MEGDNQDDEPCEPSGALLPAVLAAAGSLVLGYFFGRDAYRKDLVRAVRTVEQSPEPLEVRIRDAF